MLCSIESYGTDFTKMNSSMTKPFKDEGELYLNIIYQAPTSFW